MRIPMTEPAELLASDEYFTCRLRCRMPKATCVTRQTVGLRYHANMYRVPWECQDCALGQKIKTELKKYKRSTIVSKNAVLPPGSRQIQAYSLEDRNTNEPPGLNPKTQQTEVDIMEQKKRKCIHKVRPCSNCGRELPIQGHEMCGGCYGVEKVTPLADRADALAKARERFSHPDYKSAGGPHKKKKAGNLTDKVNVGKFPVEVGEMAAHIGISFPETERNLKVWDYLCAEADRNRRSPEAQMLWTLETLMESEA